MDPALESRRSDIPAESSTEKLRERSCPSCEGDGIVIGKAQWEDVFECGRCRLCYLRRSVRPNAAFDNGWYAELKNAPPERARRFVEDMQDSYRAQLEELSRLTRSRDIVDVGCGVGVFLAVAKEAGWTVHGVEDSPHAHQFAKQAFSLDYASSLSEFSDEQVGVVRIAHVLEHIPEPLDFLAALRRVLRPDGVLSVIVPNREPLSAAIVNRLRAARSERPRLVGSIYPHMHVLGFSPASLAQLVERAGFSQLEAKTVSMGDRSYYPMFYDGLLTVRRRKEVQPRELLRYWLPQWFDNLGNRIGRGRWIVAQFAKS